MMTWALDSRDEASGTERLCLAAPLLVAQRPVEASKCPSTVEEVPSLLVVLVVQGTL